MVSTHIPEPLPMKCSTLEKTDFCLKRVGVRVYELKKCKGMGNRKDFKPVEGKYSIGCVIHKLIPELIPTGLLLHSDAICRFNRKYKNQQGLD